MKKFLPVFFILIFSLVCFCGCNKKHKNNSVSDQKQTTESLKNENSNELNNSENSEISDLQDSVMAENQELFQVLQDQQNSLENQVEKLQKDYEENLLDESEIKNEYSEGESETENETFENPSDSENQNSENSENSSFMEFDNDNKEVFPSVEPPEDSKEITLTDKEGKLLLYSLNNEILIPQTSGKNKILISSNSKKTERKFYDDFNRLVCLEEWKIPDMENARLLKKVSYEYEEDFFNPCNKKIEEESYLTLINYDKNSNPVKSLKFFMIKSGNEGEDSKNIPVSENYYFYDEKNRLVKETSKENEYKDSNYSDLKSTFSKKILYFYNEKNVKPDYEYYENDILKIKINYSPEKGTYNSIYNFDEDYSVQSFYRNYSKIKEVYTLGGKIIRETDYE